MRSLFIYGGKTSTKWRRGIKPFIMIHNVVLGAAPDPLPNSRVKPLAAQASPPGDHWSQGFTGWKPVPLLTGAQCAPYLGETPPEFLVFGKGASPD
jgi:hypothetical protein